ncbi:MAG: hypothetical protein M5R36_00550 [Deltaproteobacteria bacterium]|nr:hypothetical protein [Deltaproteobacteria bacterium]
MSRRRALRRLREALGTPSAWLTSIPFAAALLLVGFTGLLGMFELRLHATGADAVLLALAVAMFAALLSVQEAVVTPERLWFALLPAIAGAAALAFAAHGAAGGALLVCLMLAIFASAAAVAAVTGRKRKPASATRRLSLLFLLVWIGIVGPLLNLLIDRTFPGALEYSNDRTDNPWTLKKTGFIKSPKAAFGSRAARADRRRRAKPSFSSAIPPPSDSAFARNRRFRFWPANGCEAPEGRASSPSMPECRVTIWRG